MTTTSFVLPLGTGKDIEVAVSILLPSLFLYFRVDSIDTIYIIIKKKYIDLFHQYVKKTNLDITLVNIEIIDEMELIDTTNIYLTYYLQMLLKLLIAKRIKTDYYITLDADLYFCKPCDSTFFFGDKAYYISKPKKDKWNKRVEDALDIKLDIITNQTPFVFKTELVNKMLTDLDVVQLILTNKCTEYSLYIGYLIKNNLLEDNYDQRNFTYQIITSSINNDVTKDNDIIVASSFIVDENKVISGIQSRINQHHNLLYTLKANIPTITYQNKKIGLLTVVSGNSYFKKYEKAFYTKKNYCKYHNYDFIFDIVPKNRFPRNNGWIKLYKLRQIIENYDYVMMSDADVIITNRDRRITDIALEYNLDNYMFLVTTDYNSINSGNIIWRNCLETIDFIEKVLTLGENSVRFTLTMPFKPIGVYEQPTIIYFINKYPEIRNNIKIIPQFEMNSYLDHELLNKPNIYQYIDGVENRTIWEQDDFLIHFAGFNYNDKIWNDFKMDVCIDKFVFIYKMVIIKKEGTDYGCIK